LSTAITNNRIDGTRITVWDVLHYLENGCTAEEICRWLPISEEQVAAAVEYITANREYVMQVHREIEERNARGNPPEIREKLTQSKAKMQQWLREREKSENRTSA
jgi:uncharacterized protein (DUF433 family)